MTKGAVTNVLAVCTRAEGPGEVVDLARCEPEIERRYAEFGGEGFRALGVAYRARPRGRSRPTKAHEADMTFLGFLVLHDPPKPGIDETVGQLGRLGIALKILTGDNRLVAATVGRLVGLAGPGILTGPEIAPMSDEALIQQGRRGRDLRRGRAQPEGARPPRPQEGRPRGGLRGRRHQRRLGPARRRRRHLGRTAVDVAKEAADIVLLEKDLGVLVEGVREGRVAFANTLKYVYMATSANFGNMLSMAGSPRSPLPAAAAQADPPDEPADRLARDDHRHRQRRSRIDRAAAPLGYPRHPQLHARLRYASVRFRLTRRLESSSNSACDERRFAPVGSWNRSFRPVWSCW